MCLIVRLFMLCRIYGGFAIGCWNVSWPYLLLKNNRPTWCHLLFYFTSYVFNMFRTLIYPSSGACDYSVELPHWWYCSWFDVCWSFGVVGLEWYPCWRLKHLCFSLQHGYHSNPTTPKLQHTSNQEHNCFSLQHGYHSNPTTPKLQHTSNQEQYDQCGNSTE